MALPKISQKSALIIIIPLFVALFCIGLYMWPKGKSIEEVQNTIKESHRIEQLKKDSLKTN